ncbi:hypothetical protein ACU639_01680 [Streptomyces cynarae]|uniref:hypothetical protein n=1 Tax=Streptomyces cynarae TaxID=2981134 RepID=UPI00406C6FD7
MTAAQIGLGAPCVELPGREHHHAGEAEEPPLRLLLGKDAVAVVKDMADRLATQDAQWRHVSESVSV